MITVSSEVFYWADIDVDQDGDSEAGEAVLMVTITDPAIADANALPQQDCYPNNRQQPSRQP